MPKSLVVILLVLVAAAHCSISNCANTKPSKDNAMGSNFATIMNKAILSFSVDMQEHGDEMRVRLNHDVERLFQLAASIPTDYADDELTQMKEYIRQLATALSNKNQHLGGTFLEYAINTTFGVKPSSTSTTGMSSSNDTQALWVNVAIKVGAFVTSVIQNIGTYSATVEKAARYVQTTVVPALNNRGFTKTAAVATTVSNAMIKTSQYTAKYEAKLATALQPIKQSKTFQAAHAFFQTANNILNIVKAGKIAYRGYMKTKALAKAVHKHAIKGIAYSKKVAASIKAGFKTFRTAAVKAVKAVRTAVTKSAKRGITAARKSTKSVTQRGTKAINRGIKTARYAARRATQRMKRGLGAARKAARNIAKSVRNAARSRRM